MSFFSLDSILLLSTLLALTVVSQDCVLSAVMSTYQCSYRCQVLYGTTEPNQRMFYNSSSQLCQPKTNCPTGWSYVSKNNTCVNDLGKKNTVINGWILSSNIQNLTVVYVSCNDNGDFFNGSCICNLGWGSSKTQTKVSENVTTMKFCDVRVDPINLKMSKGEAVFGQYSWGEKRQSLNQVFLEGQQWINVLVIVSIAVYSVILIFSIHNWYVTRRSKKTNPTKNVNNVPNLK